MLRSRLSSPLILVWLTPLALYAPIYLTGRAIFWGTPLLQFAPWWAQASRTLLAGELPLWNPLLGLGAPLLANYQSALLYPPTWGYFIAYALGGLPLLAWLMAPLAALHLAWGGWGMARLARVLGWNVTAQTISGLAFGLSGYAVARAHFLSVNAAVAWLPWLLLAAYRLATRPGKRPLLFFAGVCALQLLAGHAQTAWYSLLLAGLLALFWGAQAAGRNGLLRTAGRFILAGGWAAALAAAQLLPTAEYLLHSQRAESYNPELALQYSFWPWRLLTLVAPNLFGNPAHGNYWGYATFWEDAAYLGLLGLLFALAALFTRRPTDRPLRRALLAILLVSFVLALGDNTPLYPWLFAHIPTFDLFQAPARWLLWAMAALALLAGLGAHHWQRPTGRALYWSRLATAGAGAVMLGAGIGYLALPNFPPALAERLVTFIPALALAGFWGLGAGALHLLAPQTDLPSPRWVWAVGLWLAADLFVAGWGLNPAGPLSLYAQTSPHVATVRSLSGGQRVFLLPQDEQAIKFENFYSFESFEPEQDWHAVRRAVLPNTNLLDGLPAAANFDPLLPAGYAEILDWFRLPEGADEVPARAAWQAALEFLNVGLLVRPDAENAPRFATGLTSPFHPQWAHYFPAAESPLCCGPTPLEYTLTARRANRVALQVNAPAAGRLTLAELYYPGWQATLDGAPIALDAADRLWTVSIPAGEHELEFSYRPLAFYVGLGISLTALLLTFYFWRQDGA